MADTRQIHTLLRRVEQVKTWQLLVLLVLAGMVTLTFLRFTNINMVQRRDSVLQADKLGNSEALRNNLSALQRYSADHMNTSGAPLYLEESYKRDVKKVVEQNSTQSVHENAMGEADRICKSQHPGYSQAYVQCVAVEQAKFPGASPATTAILPSPSLYRHVFYSPLWTPDFTGFSVLVCIFLSLLIVVRLISLAVLKVLVRRRYSSV